MAYNKIVEEDRRFQILNFLSKENDYSMSDMVMHRALKVIGHGKSIDVINTDISWLAEQGLVTTKPVAGMVIATLTKRGLAVAEGDMVVPGITRTLPQE